MMPQLAALEARVSEVEIVARAEPRGRAAPVGIIAAGEPFFVHGHASAPGCGDWGEVDRGAFACLDETTDTTDAPTHLPRGDPNTLPYVYARLARGLPGPIYASLADFEAGAPPVARFEPNHSYHFLSQQPSARGEVLVASDGHVVPAAKAEIYAPSAFAGRDLIADPLAEGVALAWCIEPAGCTASDGAMLAFQAQVALEPVPPKGRVRRWQPAPRPIGVSDEEIWLDVHLAQQTLAVYRGDAAVFVTLVSAGVGGEYATPRGTFRILDKLVENDMISLPGAEDEYHVERVPWVAHFKPRYALHGAYWHGRFGLPASHGCVNLSPMDAHIVFDLLRPGLPPGWRPAWPTKDDAGTAIRVR
ncbi:hypothetical protein LBMAG42_21650 [Deltaproteobacteria bacterium]|nr:hypothetical protein LBMAG42_21650 [Deltaproteobacteria bacterium]